MKNLLKFILAACLTAVVVVPGYSQVKLYTKKAKLEDFPTRTTKVVCGNSSPLEIMFRSEVSSRWRLSPYEFCTPDEYEKLCSSNSYYFLRLVEEDGLVFMELTKGGKEGETDNLKKKFEVVRIPIAGIGSMDGNEAFLMGPFVDIIQNFTEQAMESDRTGYSGLISYNLSSLKGKKIYLDPDEAAGKLEQDEDDAMVAVFISPLQPGKGLHCYKMILDTRTHQLSYFIRMPFKKESDRGFSTLELKQFEARNATLVR